MLRGWGINECRGEGWWWKLFQHKDQCDSESSGIWLPNGVQWMVCNLWKQLFICFVSVCRNISHCPWFGTLRPWIFAFKEIVDLPAFWSEFLGHTQMTALMLDLPIAEISWHMGQSQFHSKTWSSYRSRVPRKFAFIIPVIQLFIWAYMKSLNF